jgi:hypothetical protein
MKLQTLLLPLTLALSFQSQAANMNGVADFLDVVAENFDPDHRHFAYAIGGKNVLVWELGAED